MTQLPKLLSVSALLVAAGCAYEEPPATYSSGYGHSVGGPAFTSSSSYTTYGGTRYESPYVTNGVYSYTPSAPGSSYLQTPSGAPDTTVYSSLPNESVGTSVNAQVNAEPGSLPQGAAPVSRVSGNENGLVANIREQLANYGRLSSYANSLDISAYQGAVTLNGTVGSRQDRDAIDAVVRNIQGVTSVNDRLQVATLPTGSTAGYVESSRVYIPNSAPQAATPVAPVPQARANTADMFNLHVRGLSDADRDVAQRIITGLQTETAVVNLMPKVNITVEQGHVFLRGTAANEQQRQQIISAVSQAAGTSVNAEQLQVAR